MEVGHRCQNLEFCSFLASSETGKYHSSCKNSGSRLWGRSCIPTWPGWEGDQGPWVLSSSGILLACFSLVSHSVNFYFLKSFRSVNFPLSNFLVAKIFGSLSFPMTSSPTSCIPFYPLLSGGQFIQVTGTPHLIIFVFLELSFIFGYHLYSNSEASSSLYPWDQTCVPVFPVFICFTCDVPDIVLDAGDKWWENQT